MAPACAEKEFGYVSRSSLQDAKAWRPSHVRAAIHVRKRRGEWEADTFVETNPQTDLKKLFGAFAEEWKSETWHISSVRRRISHPAYLKIIGMGKDALQFIFEDMRKEPSHWFWALEAITRENVAPNATRLSDVHDAWLEWAKSHGY